MTGSGPLYDNLPRFPTTDELRRRLGSAEVRPVPHPAGLRGHLGYCLVVAPTAR